MYFSSGQRGQEAGVEAKESLKQRCNPAATDLITFAKTLRAVQLKKSMPGIAGSAAASGQRLWCE